MHHRNCCLVTKWCPTLWDPMDCNTPGFYNNGVFQVRILEWVAISFAKRSSQLRGWTHISCIGRSILYHWASREVQSQKQMYINVYACYGLNCISWNFLCWHSNLQKVMVFGDMTFSRLLSTDEVMRVKSPWWDLCP